MFVADNEESVRVRFRTDGNETRRFENPGKDERQVGTQEGSDAWKHATSQNWRWQFLWGSGSVLVFPPWWRA